MNSLTYGTLPEFAEFASAFRSHTLGRYKIHAPANGTDSRMFNELNLFFVGSYCDDDDGMDVNYSVKQLYQLCETLVAILEGELGDQYVDLNGEAVDAADWAGDFCSAIMTTLGFEWV